MESEGPKIKQCCLRVYKKVFALLILGGGIIRGYERGDIINIGHADLRGFFQHPKNGGHHRWASITLNVSIRCFYRSYFRNEPVR